MRTDARVSAVHVRTSAREGARVTRRRRVGRLAAAAAAALGLALLAAPAQGSVLDDLRDSTDDLPADLVDTSGKPTRFNTGVPVGTLLTPHFGNITVTKAGTVLKNLDVHGFIDVKAPNVVIRNSVVRGGVATFNRGLINNYGYDNLVIENVDVLPLNETVWQDGVKGWDFTLRNSYVQGNVDNVKIHGDNVLIVDSLLEDTRYYESDPNQGGKATHNDGVQILKGRNIRILRNNIRDQQNFAVLGAANKGVTSGLVVKNNWFDGGHCTVKLEEMNGYNLSVTITDNLFGPNRVVSYCKIAAKRGISVTHARNYMEGSGAKVGLTWVNS